MSTADINIVLAMVVILAAIAAFAIRESAEALEAGFTTAKRSLSPNGTAPTF